jgi:hypothetical protein
VDRGALGRSVRRGGGAPPLVRRGVLPSHSSPRPARATPCGSARSNASWRTPRSSCATRLSGTGGRPQPRARLRGVAERGARCAGSRGGGLLRTRCCATQETARTHERRWACAELWGAHACGAAARGGPAAGHGGVHEAAEGRGRPRGAPGEHVGEGSGVGAESEEVGGEGLGAGECAGVDERARPRRELGDVGRAEVHGDRAREQRLHRTPPSAGGVAARGRQGGAGAGGRSLVQSLRDVVVRKVVFDREHEGVPAT